MVTLDNRKIAKYNLLLLELFPQCSKAALPEWGGTCSSLSPYLSGVGPAETAAVGGGETQESCLGDTAGSEEREDTGQEDGGFVPTPHLSVLLFASFLPFNCFHLAYLEHYIPLF